MHFLANDVAEYFGYCGDFSDKRVAAQPGQGQSISGFDKLQSCILAKKNLQPFSGCTKVTSNWQIHTKKGMANVQ